MSITLQDITDQIKSCDLCPLHKNREKGIVEQVTEDNEILILSVSPNNIQNKLGRSGIGKGFGLLNTELEKYEDIVAKVGYLNFFKCCAGTHRAAQDLFLCHFYISEQIKIIKPKIILTLGAEAFNLLSGWVNKKYEFIPNDIDIEYMIGTDSYYTFKLAGKVDMPNSAIVPSYDVSDPRFEATVSDIVNVIKRIHDEYDRESIN